MIGRRKRLFHTAGSTTGKECGSGTLACLRFLRGQRIEHGGVRCALGTGELRLIGEGQTDGVTTHIIGPSGYQLGETSAVVGKQRPRGFFKTR